MSEPIDDGGAAFPREDYQADNARGQRGMSLRDWFAGQAIVAVAIVDAESRRQVHEETGHDDGGSTAEQMAVYAYEQADAMIAERKNRCANAKNVAKE